MTISVQEFLVIERQKYLDSFQSLQSCYAIKYINSSIKAGSFYARFTNTTFQNIPI